MPSKQTPSKAPAVKKVKLDYSAANSKLMQASADTEDGRWKTAIRITETQPTALSHASSSSAAPSLQNQSGSVEVEDLRVGQVYELPIGLLDSNPYGARFFYRVENIDKVGTSMNKDTQLVPVNGYVNGRRVVLYDGETRLRSARTTGKPSLLVKIDTPPADALDQHRRSSLFNSLRSNHSHLDIAVRVCQFLSDGLYSNQDEVGKRYLDEQGQPIGSARANMYVRIGSIPMPFLHSMSEKDNTSTLTGAYAISEIFKSELYKADPEKGEALAREIIKEIQEKELGTEQTKALIKVKLEGPQSRTRAESVPVKFAGTKGTLKVFPSRGQLDLSFKGLPEEKLTELRESVEKMLAGQMAL